MSKKRNDKESMICLILKTKLKFLVYCIESKENFFTEKELFKWQWKIEQKVKRRFFNCSHYSN